jgi:hypothetical protein
MNGPHFRVESYTCGIVDLLVVFRFTSLKQQIVDIACYFSKWQLSFVSLSMEM